jgi:uncharacterized protein YerC
MKVRPRTLTKQQNIEVHDALYTAASSLKGRSAMKLFLRDLLTPSERVMLGRRIVVARELLAGMSYIKIQKKLRVGQHTIERVHHWLHDQMPGYEQALKGVEKEYTNRRIRHESNALFTNLKRKYPLHFLLFPWPRGYKSKFHHKR